MNWFCPPSPDLRIGLNLPTKREGPVGNEKTQSSFAKSRNTNSRRRGHSCRIYSTDSWMNGFPNFNCESEHNSTGWTLLGNSPQSSTQNAKGTHTQDSPFRKADFLTWFDWDPRTSISKEWQVTHTCSQKQKPPSCTQWILKSKPFYRKTMFYLYWQAIKNKQLVSLLKTSAILTSHQENQNIQI